MDSCGDFCKSPIPPETALWPLQQPPEATAPCSAAPAHGPHTNHGDGTATSFLPARADAWSCHLLLLSTFQASPNPKTLLLLGFPEAQAPLRWVRHQLHLPAQ